MNIIVKYILRTVNYFEGETKKFQRQQTTNRQLLWSEIPGNPLDNLSNVSLSSVSRSSVNDGAQYYLLCAHSI